MNVTENVNSKSVEFSGNEYDDTVKSCISKYGTLETLRAIITGKSNDITNKELISKLHYGPAKELYMSVKNLTQDVFGVKNFAMSQELATAIGTVVVQALQENAKEEGLEDEENTGDLPMSDKDMGEAEGEESPKFAPDLSADENELKQMSINPKLDDRYSQVKNFLNFSERHL
jgi:hypothetical protein